MRRQGGQVCATGPPAWKELESGGRHQGLLHPRGQRRVPYPDTLGSWRSTARHHIAKGGRRRCSWPTATSGAR